VRLRLGRAAALVLLALAAWLPATARAAPPPSLSVTAAALIEQSTGTQLYGRSANQQLPIASTTKLMTALVTLEHVPLSRVFSDPNYFPASVDSQIGLSPGERMSVHDLLLALLLPSADDAAEDLAFNVGHGSVGRFVAMMNARAGELGLTHTHYSTPIGLDTPGNYSSASDLVTLASYLLSHQPFFAHAVSLPSAVLHTGAYVRHVVNRNDLLGRVPWITGVKTGHTRGAGYVLVGSGHRDGMTLISAVLGTSSISSRDSNTLALLDYGFANFHRISPIHVGDILARLPVHDRPGFRAQVIAGTTFTGVVARDSRVSTRFELPRELTGPLPWHAPVGTAVVLAGHRTLGLIPLLLKRALPAVSPLTLAARFITRPFTLLPLLAVLCAAIGFAVHRRERPPRPGAASREAA